MTGYRKLPPYRTTRPRELAQGFNGVIRILAALSAQEGWAMRVVREAFNRGELSATDLGNIRKSFDRLNFEVEDLRELLADAREKAIATARAKAKNDDSAHS